MVVKLIFIFLPLKNHQMAEVQMEIIKESYIRLCSRGEQEPDYDDVQPDDFHPPCWDATV